MSIYTGTGDRGKTSLFSGERVTKADLQIEAYGEVDELNSVLGGVGSYLPEIEDQRRRELQKIQCTLFHIGSFLATTPGSPKRSQLNDLFPAAIERLERTIDHLDAKLPQLTQFILPGGHISASWAHVARTVCRRVERRLIDLRNQREGFGQDDTVANILIYLNRLSDYLFLLARYCNQIHHLSDYPWDPQDHCAAD